MVAMAIVCFELVQLNFYFLVLFNQKYKKGRYNIIHGTIDDIKFFKNFLKNQVVAILDSQNALEVVVTQYCPVQSLKVDNKPQKTLNVLQYQTFLTIKVEIQNKRLPWQP